MWSSGDNNRQDEELKKLALEAQNFPAGSTQRRILLTKMVKIIQNSGRICRPPSSYPERYEEIYQEACQRLFIYICKNIDNYNPQRGPVMRWVNYYLGMRFFREAMDEVIGSPQIRVQPHNPENYVQEENSSFLSELIVEYIREDPENLCRGEYMTKYPHVNFRDVALRILTGEKWREISASLNVSVSSLSDFYQRSLKKLAPEIQKYLSE